MSQTKGVMLTLNFKLMTGGKEILEIVAFMKSYNNLLLLYYYRLQWYDCYGTYHETTTDFMELT